MILVVNLLTRVIMAYKKKKNNVNRRSTGARMPPQLNSTIMVTKTLRFRCSSSVNKTITANGVIRALGMSTTVANSALTAIFQSVRIHRLELWLTPESGVGEISVDWINDDDNPISGGPNTVIADVCFGVANPAHVRCSPPRGSAASFWHHLAHSGTNQDLFKIVSTGSMVLDLTATWVMRNGNDALSTSDTNLAVAAAPNLGEVYAPALDGSTDVFKPVGRETTT